MCEAVYGGTCDCKCMTFWKSLDLRLQRLVFEEFKNSFRRQKSQFFHGKYEKSQIAPYILPQSQKTQVHRRTENMRTTTWDNDVVWHVTGERKRVLRRVTVVWLVCGIGAVRNVAEFLILKGSGNFVLAPAPIFARGLDLVCSVCSPWSLPSLPL